MELTHKELVEIGHKWLMSRCSFAFKDLVTIGYFGEVPDNIGFNSSGTFVLEAKTSMSDFRQDRKKKFRQIPKYGMGDWRFFIAPKGLIHPEDLPKMWGLIDVNEKGKAKCIYNPFGKGNIYSYWDRNPKCEKSEIIMLCSALRRIQEKGLLDNIYPDKES